MKWGKFGVITCVAALICIYSPAPVLAQSVHAYPESYDFFTVYIGDSATMTGSLRNENGGTISITGYEWAYNPLNVFAVSSGISLPHPLPSGASVDYQVTFTSTEFSFWNATLRFYTDSSVTPTVDVQFWAFSDYPPSDPCFPLTDCGGTCVDTDSDITNCGGCGNVCPAPVGGSATCIMGACGTDCGDLTDCGGVCLDLENDVDNCGACGNVCPDPSGGSAVCSAGTCGNDCGPLTDCGGVCIDTNWDANNCGGCGNVCAGPVNGSGICVSGGCDVDCDLGYVYDGTECIPEAADPRDLLDDLLQFFDDGIADGTLEGTSRRWWGRAIQIFVMRRHLVNAIWRYEDGRYDRMCFYLDRAYLRSDGMRSPRDFIQGPAVDDFADQILDAMFLLECS